MGGSGTDEHLLYGVLAVQLGFATPAQVMAAGAAWMADRDRDLAGRLLDTGALSEKQSDMLAGMVAEALRANAGNSGEALDAFGGARVVEQTFAGSLVLDPSGEVRPAPESTPDTLVEEVVPRPDVTCEDGGRYDIRHEHGRGGQARVMLAFDQHIGREIAFKELLSGASGRGSATSGTSLTSTAVTRFLREARITGQLEHPNIVPVHEVGQRADGQAYYTMRLVRGQTLGAKLRGCKSLGERLDLLGPFWDVCNAIAFAHSKGVVHRDIKPDNVMVGAFGETVVLDWGLAKTKGVDDIRGEEMLEQVQLLKDWTEGQTIAGSAMGTPSYMSPEQAEGLIDQIDERSDVWGLGAVLFEILTGRPPFVGETPFEIVGKAMSASVESVESLCPEAPPDLGAVVAKALAKKRQDRYQSAEQMAADVSAYMTGSRVGAYEYSSWELLKRFAVRNKAAVAAVSLVLATVLLALVMVAMAYRDESAARLREREALVQQVAAQREARFHLAQAYAHRAERLVAQRRYQAGRVYAAASLLTNPAHPGSAFHVPGFAESNPKAHWLVVKATSLIHPVEEILVPELEQVFSFEAPVNDLAFLGDGKAMVIAVASGRVIVVDTVTGRILHDVMGHQPSEYLFVAALGEDTFVSVAYDRKLKVWRVGNRVPLREIELDARLIALAISVDGTRAAVGAQPVAGSKISDVRLVDLRSMKQVGRLEGFGHEVHSLDFSPDGAWLAAGSWDKQVYLFPLAPAGPVRLLSGHAESVKGVKFSPDSSLLASGGYDGKLRIWNPQTAKLVRELDGDANVVNALDYSSDGEVLATGGDDHRLHLWSARDGRPLAVIEGEPQRLHAVAFSPESYRVATGGAGRLVKIWRLGSGSTTPRRVEPDWLYGLALSADGRLMASGSWDGEVLVLSLPDLGVVRRFQTQTPVFSVAFSPSGDHLAVGHRHGALRIFSLKEKGPPLVLKGHKGTVVELAFSSDGLRLVSTSSKQEAFIWDAVGGQKLHALTGHVGKVRGLVLVPDGSRALTVDDSGHLRSFDLRTGEALNAWLVHSDFASGLDVTSDGRYAVTSGKDGHVVVWDLSTGTLHRRLDGGRGWVTSVSISPDDSIFATGEELGRIVLWDLKAGIPLQELQVKNFAERVMVTRDGRHLAVIHKSTLELFPLPEHWTISDPQAVLDQARKTTGLQLDGFDLKFAGTPAVD